MYLLFMILSDASFSNEVLYSSPDSHSYVAVSEWIGSGIKTERLVRRPVFYPTIIFLSKQIFGSAGIWIVQFLLWLTSVLLTFGSVRKITGRSSYAWMGLILITSNAGLIAFTWHALTEVTTVAILSLLVFLLACNVSKEKLATNPCRCTFLLSLLSITKPVFVPAALLSILPAGRKFLIKNTKKVSTLLVLLFCVSPLIIQVLIFHHNFGRFRVSEIGSITFQRYILAQSFADANGVTLKKAREQVKSFTNEDKITFAFNHSRQMLNNFFTNVKENISGDSIHVIYPRKDKTNIAYRYMRFVNRTSFHIHTIFIMTNLILIIFCVKNNRFAEAQFLSFLSCLQWYIFLSSGISFWQGDRLTLPAIAIWSVTYPFCIMLSAEFVKHYLKILPKTNSKIFES